MVLRRLLVVSFVLWALVPTGVPFARTSELPSAAIGSITGTVTDNQGAPVANVSVYVYTTFELHLLDQLVGQTQTDSSGHYVVSNVPNGSFAVFAKNSLGYVDELYDDVPCVYNPASPNFCDPFLGTPVVVAGGGITPNINFSLRPGGRISGAVADAQTSALLDGLVTIYDSEGLVLWRGFAVSGSYQTPALLPGSYFAAVAAPTGYASQLFSGLSCGACSAVLGTPITVTAGGVTAGIDFRLVQAGSISGSVRESGTLAPLASGVAVFSPDGVLVDTASAGVDGQYAVAGLAAGTYFARTINTLGYKDKVFNDLGFCDPGCRVTDGTPIVVNAGQDTGSIDFNLTAGTELVQNPHFSNGLSGWSLYATPDNSYLSGQVTAGVFNFYRVDPPPGTANSAVILQNTQASVAGDVPVLVQFDLANSSNVRKRISVLVHDQDFSDLSVCTFWLPAQTAARRYGMLTHPTKAWANASVSFYAASAGSNGGYYQLDNVTMQTTDSPGVPQTQCVDPQVAPPGGVAPGPELIVNGSFSSGNTQGWTLFGQITSQVTGGVFDFYRPSPNADPAGVIFQSVGPAASGDRFTARFELGNNSNVRKRITTLLHDGDFSDLTACTFWLDPGQPLSIYTMQGRATRPWTSTTLSIYAATPGNETWMQLDNVSLKRTPAGKSVGIGCFEPGSVQPNGPLDGTPPGPCTFQLSPPNGDHFSVDGGTVDVSVLNTQGMNCAWTTYTVQPWLIVESGSSGVGNGTVTIRVGANHGPDRGSSVTIAGHAFTVSQVANQTCAFTVTPSTSSASPNGQMIHLVVTNTVGQYCPWTGTISQSPPSWYYFFGIGQTVTGSGSTSVDVLVQANTGAARSGTINIAGQTVTINQNGTGMPANAAAVISLQSDPGDYIGQGVSQTFTYVGPQQFMAMFDAASQKVQFSSLVAPSDPNLSIQAPSGQALAAGYFNHAQRWPFQTSWQPGLDVGWDHRGCNNSTGRFIIGEMAVDANGYLQRLHATFEQHCEGRSPALRGTIWIDMAGSTTPPAAPVLPTVATPVTEFTYTSDPGDVLGGGNSGAFALADAVFVPTADPTRASIGINVPSGPSYFLQFRPSNGQMLEPGTYDPVTNNLSSTDPVLFTTGFGGCAGTVTGKFTVLEYTYGTKGDLYSFHATFELRCGGSLPSDPALRGEVRIMADPWR